MLKSQVCANDCVCSLTRLNVAELRALLVQAMLMKSLIAAATLLASSTHALYFYLDGTTPKCFYEELARDTLVVGKESVHSVWHPRY